MIFDVNLPMLIGLLFILISIISKRYPSRKVNSFYGYRSRRSMKNSTSWNYAQSIYPAILMKGGIGLSITGVLLLLMGSSQHIVVIAGISGMLIVFIFLFVHVERKLKHFLSENKSKSHP